MAVSPYVLFAVFALLLLALWWASRQISLLIQENIYLVTGSADMAMVILFLIYLPGIVIHEGSHWLVAKLLGLKTGKFRVWPKKQGRFIGLGSINVKRGGTLRDSLVGLAPLLVGSILVALIGEYVFRTRALSVAWRSGDWVEALSAIYSALLGQTDGLIWAYLIFSVANAMMPSASDREPARALLLYLALLGALYVLLDQSGRYLLQFASWLLEPIQLLASALLFTLTLDLGMILFLFAVQALLIVVTGATVD